MKHTVEEVELSTGTKGLLIDVPNAEVVDVKIYFRAGYQFGDFDKFEIPHVLEHHLLNASKKYPKNNQLSVEISKNGAVHNAYTSLGDVSYWTQCASFEVDRILSLMVESITQPLFPESAFITEKENVRTELSKYLSEYPRQVSVLNLVSNFPELYLPFEERLKQLDHINHQDVIDYYKNTHTSLNGGFVVAGAVNENRKLILDRLEELFQKIPSGSKNEFLDQLGLGQKKPLLKKAAIDSLYFNLSWFAEGGDDTERVAYRLLRTILANGFASRIFGKARDRGLTYNIAAYVSHSHKASDIEFAGFVNPDKLESLLELISTEVTDIIENGVTEAELDAARELVVGSVVVRTQTVGAIAGWYTSDYVYDGSTLSYEDFFKLIRATRPEEVQAAAKKLFLSPKHSSAYVGPLSKAELSRREAVLKPIWQ